MFKIVCGEKYFRKIHKNEFEIVRVIKINNEKNTIIIKDEKTKLEKEVDDLYLYDWTSLRPDAYIFFNIVELGPSKDVIIATVRADDFAKGNSKPYCAARQYMVDHFSEIIKTKDQENILYVGLSMNRDNCPSNVEFDTILSCTKLIYTEEIAYYIDDILDTILSLVENKDKYNEVFKELHDNKHKAEQFKLIEGTCESLEEFCKQKNIMYDIHYGFGIYDVNFVMELDLNDITYINPLQRREIENIIKSSILNVLVYKFDKRIDLRKIEKSYILINDLCNDLYLIAYDTGDYTNPSAIRDFNIVRDQISLMNAYLNIK